MQVNTYSSHAVLFGSRKPIRKINPGIQTDRPTTQAAGNKQRASWLKTFALLPLIGMLAQPVLAGHKEGGQPTRKLTQAHYFLITHPYFQKYFTKAKGGHGKYCNNGFAMDDPRKKDWENCYHPQWRKDH
jgi:hypothetical protein